MMDPMAKRGKYLTPYRGFPREIAPMSMDEKNDVPISDIYETMIAKSIEMLTFPEKNGNEKPSSDVAVNWPLMFA